MAHTQISAKSFVTLAALCERGTGTIEERAQRLNHIMAAVALLGVSMDRDQLVDALSHIAEAVSEADVSVIQAKAESERVFILVSGQHEGEAAIMTAATKIMRKAETRSKAAQN